MLPSEKVELAIYRYVNISGGRSVSLGNLASVIQGVESSRVVERLKDLYANGRIALFKYVGATRIAFGKYSNMFAFQQLGSGEQLLQRWPSAEGHFFGYRDFVVEVTPQGRKYFEDLEQRDTSENPKPAVPGAPQRKIATLDVIQEWKPENLTSELKYRNSLAAFARERLSTARVETEYRHLGTTTDVYIKTGGSSGEEVFVELKRNLRRKSEFDRLIGQIESLKPKEHSVIIVLCGEMNLALVGRVKERCPSMGCELVVKEVANAPSKSLNSSRGSKKTVVLPPWPKKMGEYSATSSARIPSFPRVLSGYRSEEGKDFWGKPYPTRGWIRIFQGVDWEGLPNFPNPMNGCSHGAFMIRWRLSDPEVRVHSTARNSRTSGGTMATSAFGYMYATNCDQPLFKFAGTVSNNGSTLVDVFYELKFWQAAP